MAVERRQVPVSLPSRSESVAEADTRGLARAGTGARLARTAPRGIVKYSVLIGFLAASVLPFLWILGIALKSKPDFYSSPFGWPETFQWSNLSRAWEVGRFGDLFLNSMILTVPTVAGVAACSALAGYALAKLTFHGREPVFYALLAGMMIPFQAVMIPLYYQLRDLGLLGTYLAGILPLIALGLPFGIFLMRAFILNLPDDLVDASRVDGANELEVFLHIVVPLARSALATVVIVQFIASWNAFLLPLLYMQDQDLRPLTLGLLNFSTRYSTDYTLVSAGVLILTVPMVTVYLIFQKQFIRGLTAGALKGG
ncbi:MAG: carbohydrate ABC transporter permease [Thermomicrobiales bacterium]